MAKNLAYYIDQIESSTRGRLDNRVDRTELVNDAGEHLCNMYPWPWMDRPPKLLSFAAPVTFTNATYNESGTTYTLTDTQLDGLAWLPGNTVQITGGTNAVKGQYEITAFDDATDKITLAKSIGATDSDADVDGTIRYPYVLLPSDLSEVISITATSSLEEIVHLTTLSVVNEMRNSVLHDVFEYWAAVVFPSQSNTTSVVNAPRLEVFPAPGSLDADAFTMVYKAGWVVLDSMGDVPNIPIGMEPLFTMLVREFAVGTVGNDLITRLHNLELSNAVRVTKQRYGMTQPNLGQMTGGIVRPPDEIVEYRPHERITRA